MAQTRARGHNLKVLAAFESTYGTMVDGSGGGAYTQMPVGSYGLGLSKGLTRDPILHGGRDMNDQFHDAQTVEGGITVPVDHDAFGFWLKLLAGAPATVNNSGVYTHTFTFGGADLPSMSIDAGHTGLSTAKHFVHTGVRANSMAIQSGRAGQAWADLDLVAQNEAEASSAEDASPVETHVLSPNAFVRRRGVMTLGGSAIGSLMGWSVNVNNNLEAIETIRTDGLTEDHDPGEVQISGDITVRFSTATDIQNPGKNETPVALQAKMNNPADTRSLTFDMPRVWLPQVKREVSGPDGIDVTYSWVASLDDSSNFAAKATLINTIASY